MMFIIFFIFSLKLALAFNFTVSFFFTTFER